MMLLLLFCAAPPLADPLPPGAVARLGSLAFDHGNGVVGVAWFPDGSCIAFLDHEQWLDDRGWVKVVDRAGKVATLSREYAALEGLAWTPDGARLYSSGSASTGADTIASFVPIPSRHASHASASHPRDRAAPTPRTNA